jgi:tRNA-specific 2-thiouridylase
MKTVYVGLSGGVDSSVTAALLQKEGYNVVGVYMKNWTQDLPGVKCPWKEDLGDARAVAAVLDIPFKVFDFQTEYRKQVVDYMIAEYQAGRTPNPDIMCNQEIKFKLFLDAAVADGADMIATGHYAKVDNGELLRGVDDNKDQTYFLYRVSGKALAKTLMPIGNYTKPEVRQLAFKFNLPTAAKKDSQGICFVGPVGMKAFLAQYVQTAPGPIVDQRGKEIGQHDGAVFYTIGQRQGLGVGGGKPYYVTGKNMETNTVYVTDNPDDLELHSDHILLSDIHWIGAAPDKTVQLQVRLRHRGQLIDCHIKGDELVLSAPQRAIAAGQSAVIYDGQKVLGGGIIQSAFAPAVQS